MPSISTVPSDDIFEPSESFAVINKDSFVLYPPVQETPVKPFKNVNIVKPVLRTRVPDKNEFVFRVELDDEDSEQETRPKRKRPTEPAVHSQTILDPHFSRHLDLKLRRLKEKEIIAERLSRRSKERQQQQQQQQQPIVMQKVSKLNADQNRSKPNVVNMTYENDEKPIVKQKKIVSSNSPLPEKPLFITTVKKGEFLPPPASMATLLGLTSCERLGGAGAPTLVYSYASRPKMVAPSTRDVTNAKGAALEALASLAVAAAGVPSRASQAAFSYGNLMTDRRIVRGSTTAFHGGLGDEVDEAVAAARGARAAAARRRAVARRRGAGAPGVLPGGVTRRHEPVQTEPYLEELYDKGSEMEIGVQTDLLLDRLETPVYVPEKSGCDVETQIIPGDLFDFEVEVEPVLEVLVGKTIEQAITECLEEEEMANARKQVAIAAEVRAHAAASARHRQKHLVKLHNVKEKRSDEEDEGLRAEQREMAMNLVRTHLPTLLPELFTSLKDQGYIADASPELQETFLPWLMTEVTQEVESMITSKEVLMDIVKEVIETRAELYRAMGEDDMAEITTSTSSNPSSNVSEASQRNGDDGPADEVDNEY